MVRKFKKSFFLLTSRKRETHGEGILKILFLLTSRKRGLMVRKFKKSFFY